MFHSLRTILVCVWLLFVLGACAEQEFGNVSTPQIVSPVEFQAVEVQQNRGLQRIVYSSGITFKYRFTDRVEEVAVEGGYRQTWMDCYAKLGHSYRVGESWWCRYQVGVSNRMAYCAVKEVGTWTGAGIVVPGAVRVSCTNDRILGSIDNPRGGETWFWPLPRGGGILLFTRQVSLNSGRAFVAELVSVGS